MRNITRKKAGGRDKRRDDTSDSVISVKVAGKKAVMIVVSRLRKCWKLLTGTLSGVVMGNELTWMVLTGAGGRRHLDAGPYISDT